MRNEHKRSNRNDGKPCKVYQKIPEHSAAYCGNREDNRYQSHGRVNVSHGVRWLTLVSVEVSVE